MAQSDPNLLQTIHRISEALNGSERGRIFYLCETLDTDNNVACVEEMLLSKMRGCDLGHLFLAELMVHLRRFDILRKVLNANRSEMERIMRSRQVLPRFRVLMVNISEDIASEDLNSVKFLLRSTLPHEKIDKAKNFLDLITELEKLDRVSSEKVDFVEECLRNVGRVDLAKKVNVYKMSGVAPEAHSSQWQSHRVPSPSPTPNSSYSIQQRRFGRSRHNENTPASSYRLPSCQSPLDSYKFSTDPRGVCVIIDCVGNDGDMLEHTFKSLHFDVVLHKWLGVDDTLSTLRGVFSGRENHEGDGFVCCIISRGTACELLATDSYSAGLNLDRVRRLFTADACPMLAGKPKLFFIQRYSVPEFQPCARTNHRDEDLETDGCDGMPGYGFIPTDADVMWSHCWTDEYNLQQRHHRSVYLKALADALHKSQNRERHLIDVHVKVNEAIFEHNRRNPAEEYHIELKHTLRKNLYL